MKPDLIFDLGMNNGDDTDFYLRKGFQVVAVEANPELCFAGHERFANHVREGRLRIINKCITRASGVVDLFVNEQVSGWTTADPVWLKDRSRKGASVRVIRVPAATLQEIVEDHGVPYYVKADVQGMELACLEALLEFEERPKFVSISTGMETVGAQPLVRVKRVLELFTALGYRKFKIVQQSTTDQQRCPWPAREGLHVEHTFPQGSSGLFGHEVPGEWLNGNQALREYRRIITSYRFAGNSPWPWPSAWFNIVPFWRVRWALDRVFWRGFGWYDTHAMHGV